MKNQTIQVTRSSMPPFEEYVEEIKELWESHWLTNMGKKHEELRERLREYLCVPNVELVVNGHMALESIIQAMDLKGEIITTPFTFASTTHAIRRNGIRPVFCDINKEDYTIDTSEIEKLITEKTTAILAVHVYGNICNTEEIESIAKKNNLKVIYDAAHAFGVKYKGKGIASYGDASCFSFHATKVFNTIEGGCICFGDNSLANPIQKIRDFGIKDEETIDTVGTNAKMNEFCASMGLCNLRHLDEEIDKRKKVVERYRNNFSGIKGIKLNVVQKDVEPNYAYFPIVVDESIFGTNRDYICSELKKNNINARKYFYPLTNSFECYAKDYKVEDTPNAFQISKSIICLPLFSELDLLDVDRITEIIFKCRRYQ